MAKLTIKTPEDFGFLPVVYSHGWFQCAPFHWEEESRVLTRVLDVDSGPIVLRLREHERGALELDTGAGQPSKADQALIGSTVRQILQLDRDITGFHDLCRQHEHLARIPELGAGRFLRCPTVWEELVKAICGTNVQWPQAVRMIGLVAELGEPVAGYHAWPSPERVLEAGEVELRERCRLGYRAPYIVELAEGLSTGEIDLRPIERHELQSLELRKAFLAIKGVGAATADYLMILNGIADRLSIDSAVYAYVTEHHFGGRRPSAAEIDKLYEPYGEWRAYAYWFEALQAWWWGPDGFDFTPDPTHE